LPPSQRLHGLSVRIAIDPDGKARHDIQKSTGILFRQVPTPLGHHQCVANLEPPERRDHGFIVAYPLKGRHRDRMSFIDEGPACRDGRIQNERN
jgi:hypothetical protein